ncbi:hypothetical protein P3X46_019405 [Hevea brasiliensis]|uniref:MADS-box domain-containing protein n=1 Tax=Hevea brasiliensis TaxID=3981 RepID=A0ABQ9LIP2_HEVBR|nr:agamous-like MADS-box protein AP3 [Hevea brasiliensis]KAJ9167812.1 hypothetical protein P3X46_019405 [Hevea brasiliensis]
MGRGKLNMELIMNEKSRMITYHKRKKGLIKKMQELSILCDVDACVIILGPNLNNRPIDVETWPTDRYDMRRIINRFLSMGNERRKNQDLSGFFVARQKKLDDEIAKLRKACLKAKFPTWDNRLNLWQYHELTLLDGVLGSKLEIATSRVLKSKGDNYLMFGSIDEGGSSNNKSFKSSSMASTFANALRQKNMEFEVLEQEPLSFVNLSHQTLPQMPPFNLDSLNSPMLMMMKMTNGEGISQFGGECSSKRSWSPFKAPTNAMMMNNPGDHPVRYWSKHAAARVDECFFSSTYSSIL